MRADALVVHTPVQPNYRLRLRRRRQTQAAIEVGGELRGGLLARTVAHAHLALALDRDDTLIREHVG